MEATRSLETSVSLQDPHGATSQKAAFFRMFVVYAIWDLGQCNTETQLQNWKMLGDEVVGLEQGPLSLLSTTEELLGR
jgi:putative AlgH/UPF0301 family transcriptional regulator